jgi:hypothetical protein
VQVLERLSLDVKTRYWIDTLQVKSRSWIDTLPVMSRSWIDTFQVKSKSWIDTLQVKSRSWIDTLPAHEQVLQRHRIVSHTQTPYMNPPNHGFAECSLTRALYFHAHNIRIPLSMI